MAVKISNNAVSRLAGSIGETDTFISVLPGDGAKFPSLDPGDWFPATLVKSDGSTEICKVTARAGDVLTVLRGQEGNPAIPFNAGDRIELRMTAATWTEAVVQSVTVPPQDNVGPIILAPYGLMFWDETHGIYISQDCGESKAFAMEEPPPGYLLENGAAVSRTTYAGLFARIGTKFGEGDGSTTFTLPESRGEIIRGLDKGRGVDPGRTLASTQAGQNESHNHTATITEAGNHAHSGSSYGAGGHGHSAWTDTQGSHTHSLRVPVSTGVGIGDGVAMSQNAGYGNLGAAGAHAHNVGVSAVGDHAHTLAINAAGVHTHAITLTASGATETRMRNVARLFCIKY